MPSRKRRPKSSIQTSEVLKTSEVCASPSLARTFAACAAVAALCIALANARPAWGAGRDETAGVGVTELPNVQIPLGLEFVDCGGKAVTLADCFDGTRPVILTMNYSDCPSLCSVQLNGLFEALGKMPWDLGGNYRLLTVSIDPAEKPERARSTKEKYLKAYGRPGTDEGWQFLTGTEENIQKLADTVGFAFKYVPEQKIYSHAAVFMVCTPDGRVSRYLYGVRFDPETVRLSLLEAAEGKVGGVSDRVLLFCYQYDPESGGYVPAAMNIMRAGGVLIVLALGGVIGGAVLVRRVRQARREPCPPPA